MIFILIMTCSNCISSLCFIFFHSFLVIFNYWSLTLLHIFAEFMLLIKTEDAVSKCHAFGLKIVLVMIEIFLCKKPLFRTNLKCISSPSSYAISIESGYWIILSLFSLKKSSQVYKSVLPISLTHFCGFLKDSWIQHTSIHIWRCVFEGVWSARTGIIVFLYLE